MKSTCSTIIPKIRSKFHFTFPIEILELFLKEIFIDLTKRASSTTLEKHIFIDYMNFPIILSDKLFNLINSSPEPRLKESDFFYSLAKMYLGEIEIILHIFASLLDLTNDGYIHRSDVYLLLSFLDYKHLNTTKEIVDAFFNDSKSLKKQDFINKSTESNMDLLILFMVYCLAKAPFSEEQVNYFYDIKNNFKYDTSASYFPNTNHICSNSNGINIGYNLFKSSISNQLIAFIDKRFDLYLGNNDSDNESLDDYSELSELTAFEDNLSCVLSNIEIEVLNPTKRKISLNDYSVKTHEVCSTKDINHKPSFNINDSLRKRSFQVDAPAFTPGTLMQCNSQSQAQVSIKPLALPLIKSSSSLLTFDFKNSIQMIYQDMNNTIKQCRLVLISNCLFIETEINITSNYSDYLSSLSHSSTYDKVTLFKYAYLISLSTSFTETIGKSTLPGIEGIFFYGFKVISLLNGNRKEMKFYSKDKTQLDHFIVQINKIESNSSMLSNFDIIKQIGSGEYSRVYLAKQLKNNKMIALKELYKETSKEQNIKTKWEKEILILLSYATHSNVIQSYYHFKTQQSLFFVLEYVPTGTLSQFLFKNKGNIDIYTKYNIIYQLCLGLSFLHSLKIVHCDLKPDNILLDISDHSSNQRDITVKITDFGFAHILTKNQSFYESFGTLVYIAPEILQRLPYSFKVDIWSLGVIIFQILFEEIPFGENSNDFKMIKNTIVKGQFSFPNNIKTNIGINKVYYDIITKCLNVDSEKRPKCKEIISLIQFNNEVNGKGNYNYNKDNLIDEDEHYANIANLNTKH